NLEARIATAQAEPERAIQHWEKAIEDKLNYGEPPGWFYPVRESLGVALLLNGQASPVTVLTFQKLQPTRPLPPRSGCQWQRVGALQV
ncbi:MAG: hypothetical protein WA637_04325, partial [Terriglobales bacterium]